MHHTRTEGLNGGESPGQVPMEGVKLSGIGMSPHNYRLEFQGRPLPVTHLELVIDANKPDLLKVRVTLLVDAIDLAELAPQIECEWIGGMGGFRRLWWRAIGRLRRKALALSQ